MTEALSFDALRVAHATAEAECVAALAVRADLDGDTRSHACTRGAEFVRTVRGGTRPALMEAFLAEYGLSTDEGVALMCLAEALLRVPDADTIDALIEDKIAPSEWGTHLGKSASSLVNASTWALMLTGRVLERGDGMAQQVRALVKRLGEPVIRVAVARAMKELGSQFVLGETIEGALKRGRAQVDKGYAYSFDMLGEAALTAADADRYFDSYVHAIAAIGETALTGDIRDNPGISVKLSALHPRYETLQRQRVMDELVPRLRDLARRAARAGIGLNVDAEEAERLELSLEVIAAALADPKLSGWDGFGVVVQAYGKRAAAVIDWVHTLATRLDRRIMVRLVKGAYWDREIKRAQVEGLADFPVFTRKSHTDISYIACARTLLGMTDRIYPQFATHNAHTIATVLELAGNDTGGFEFQRLHGMGESLHQAVMSAAGTRCRIYAPVGTHRDLLAYLVRRLLENGANSSFVNQIVDTSIPAAQVAADPFTDTGPRPSAVRLPKDLFAPDRPNSSGVDLFEPAELAALEAERAGHKSTTWDIESLVMAKGGSGPLRRIVNPADPADTVGTVRETDPLSVGAALAAARPWATDAKGRKRVLRHAAALYESRRGEFLALLTREAGKTLSDGISEIREAVDFLNYYSGFCDDTHASRGVFTCVSPWNFPLAIFSGQIAAALAAGNGVIAKPAETTPLVAHMAVSILHEAGVPREVLQLVLGTGAGVGGLVTGDPRIAGVCFTGSTATAQRINRTMAESLSPTCPLVAETGGINAMIVDSTALPEQAVRDIVMSAFRSAGQRCSALRVLYLQEDIAHRFKAMLFGAMDELVVGDPWEASTDLGPVITEEAASDISAYVEAARADGRVLKAIPAPRRGHFVGPVAISVDGMAEIPREVFGPVLHIATFAAHELDRIIDDVNASGHGLTFGLHTRIDARVDHVTARLRVGNMYVNRNQIGAIVGSQPFGGEGLSGTGPKAGGPQYVARFMSADRLVSSGGQAGASDPKSVAKQIAAASVDQTSRSAVHLPGPTGELNRLTTHARGVILCLGPTAADATRQARIATAEGCAAIQAPGLAPDALANIEGLDAVASFASDDTLRATRRVLAARDGKIIPLLVEDDMHLWCRIERHLCVDTTAAGGNATLLAASETA